MSNKNPFELRTEVLALAKDYMDKQLELNVAMAKRFVEIGDISAKEYEKLLKPYTVEQLLEQAQKMYSFVTSYDGKPK